MTHLPQRHGSVRRYSAPPIVPYDFPSMLIKSADDKSKRIALLQDLQKSPLLQRQQVQWLHDELLRLKRGLQGERDAAHYLDNYLKDGPRAAA